MATIPQAVANELVRALGRYLRATPAVELPTRLRPFKNFHAKALSTRRDELLQVLDRDEGLRARIVEWLDDKPSISANDAELLRIASERATGWEDKLAGTIAKKPVRTPKTDTAPAPDGQAKKERERAEKARSEAKRIREQAQEAMRELKTELAAARAEAKSERTALRTAEKRIDVVERDAAKARSDLERERRKVKADRERATQEVAEAKRELREVRRELQSRLREIARLEDKVLAQEAKGRRPHSTPKGRRKPMLVPKGRLEDAPETLDDWLNAPDVHLLVDGYNATMSEGGFANLDLAGQRRRLFDEVGRLARRKSFQATIVFDGSDVVAEVRRGRSPVRVQYSKPGEIADDHLIGLLETMPPNPVVLATGDRELQERGRKLGATIATSRQLLALLR